jgi:hypothetical protein
MTRTEERLTDALTATADSIGQDTLQPLIARPHRRRRYKAWAVPLAAAAGVLLVIGLVVAGQLSRSGPDTEATAGAVPRYYVGSVDAGKTLTVRSVATGAITATVPYPAAGDLSNGVPVVASARNGMFFAAIYRGKSVAEQIYQFQVTEAGQVSGFAPVAGGQMPHGQDIDTIAASPDGSLLAIGLNTAANYPDDDQIIVIHTGTGAKTVWRGAAVHRGQFSVSSLSWTANDHELAVLGQWCQQFANGNESCQTPAGAVHRTAEVWALNPASGGGQLSKGHLLLRQSARNPYISQAVLSPDGSAITAVVLTRRQIRSGDSATVVPGSMVVRQISVATGKQLRVLYSSKLPRSDLGASHRNIISLSPDSSGRYWMISAILDIDNNRASYSFNGWIRGRKLVPLPPSYGNTNSSAW